MKDDLTTIEAHPRESLRIVLKNVGSMPRIAIARNVVVLRPGTDGAVFTTAGMTARETEFIAPSAKAAVLTATAVAGAGETVEITFRIPAKPVTYPFVCTFPGHYTVRHARDDRRQVIMRAPWWSLWCGVRSSATNRMAEGEN